MAEKKMPADSDNAPANNKTGTTARRTRARYNTPPAKMNAKTEVELVEESFAQLTQYGERLASRFYERLFEQHEELAKVFGSVSMDGQQKKFFASLVLIVQSLRQPEVLEDYLRGLGARHHHYGVKASYYSAVENNLLAAMAEFAGDAWTHEVNEAWANTLNRVTTIMKAASSPEQSDPKAVETTAKEPANIDAELAQFKAIMDNVRTPIMIIDRELVITYANLAMIELLSTHENRLAEHCPGLSLSALIGTNIQQFHPNPHELVPFLSSLANLPHRVDIDIGHLSFNLNISALLDVQGRYIGNVMEWSNVTESKHRDAMHDAQLAALNKVMNVATVNVNGTIIDANDNFLAMMSYDRDELMGLSHQLFMPKDSLGEAQQTDFWARLQQGYAESGEFRRVNRHGEEVWWQGAYTPVFDEDGQPDNIMIYVTDITASKLRHAEVEGQLNAIDKTMSVISYDMDGTILSVNQQFLDTAGYREDEVLGRHHSMFVEPNYAASQDYQLFWDNLRQGQPERGEFKRLLRNGKEKWIQASYNPICDISGKPIKVVRYATDITVQKSLQSEVETLLDETSAVMTAMSEGDLTTRIVGTYDRHFALLQNAVNDTLDKMNTMAKEILYASGCIGASASEIATETTDLRQRTEQQSQALTEVTQAMSTMTHVVAEQLSQTTESKQLTDHIQQQAESGQRVSEQVHATLTTLGERDQDMTRLLETMSDMMFKTNLLALNAAVEAAKAGEQGRGFALIASEIRQITQRSSDMLKEVKIKWFDHQQQTTESADLSSISADSWQDVVSASQHISAILSTMLAAEDTQTQDINQVNLAVAQLREITNNNAELVQKTASASQLLKQKEYSLAQLISFFQTE